MKEIDLKNITTEQRNEKTLNIYKENSLKIAKLINNEDKKIAIAIEKELESIAKAIEIGASIIKNGGRIFYIGAGTSGRIGVLDAAEMPPTFGVSSDLIIGIIAGGEDALQNPIEGAEDSKRDAIEDLKEYQFSKKDFLIGIAASGRTPYVVSAIEYANSLGAISAAISTSLNSEIGKIAKLKIEPIVGPEVITGSTRMKSGTAQKMVVNMISTGTMIKLGKVYQNLMVDVKATNDKLRARAIQIVYEITNREHKEIEEVLKKAKWSVKIAIVMLKKQLSEHEAKELLLKNDNNLINIL